MKLTILKENLIAWMSGVIILIILIAFCAAIVQGYQRNKAAAKAEQMKAEVEREDAFMRATMNQWNSTNLYRREMSVVNSGHAKPHNNLSGSGWYWYVLRDADMDKEYLVVVCGGNIAVTKLESRP